MYSLLFCLVAGYLLGTFLVKGSTPYLLSVPLSPLVFLGSTIFLTSLRAEGMQIPDVQTLIIAGLLQSPLLMIGVYLARRKSARSWSGE